MKYLDNVPFIKKGLEVSQISFSGGRTAASIANHGGITHLDYYGVQRHGDIKFYEGGMISAWAQVFRPFVQIDGDLYYLEFNNTRIYPFGYSSECRVGNVSFSHGMWLLNDAFVFVVKPLDKNLKAKVTFKLHLGEHNRITRPTRTWEKFTLDEETGCIIACVKDSYVNESPRREDQFGPDTIASETWLGIAASGELKIRETPESFRKSYFGTDCRKSGATLTVAFGHQGREAFVGRLAELRSGAMREAGKLVKDYEARMAAEPQISLRREAAQSVLMNVGPILDSLKVKDIPGAMRAADSGYWVWGWDSMVYPEAYGFAADPAIMTAMLDFYRRTADPKKGIIHAMRLDQKPALGMVYGAQCIYAVLLYHAYAFTGDRKLLSEYLPFARSIMAKAGESEIAGTGLTKGLSLYPDSPQDLGQDLKNDISVFNNSIYYQALRAMAVLSAEAGNKGDANEYGKKAARTRAGFEKFYDPEKGYFFDSLSAIDFSPRRHYPLYAILWMTPFAGELVAAHAKEIARFMIANFTARHGLRNFPKWDPAFAYDGCQLCMYMTVIEPFHREMMKMERNAKGVSALFDNMDWFWSELNVPEALTCECENHGITVDNPGRKQGFTAKAWLAMLYHIAAGLNVTTEGLEFSACDSEEVTITNLVIRGRSIDIHVSGRGWNIAKLLLNGKAISAPYKIPFSELKKCNKITVRRGK